jgi:lipopolysaccharide export LptBFGC system permease protein LptF
MKKIINTYSKLDKPFFYIVVFLVTSSLYFLSGESIKSSLIFSISLTVVLFIMNKCFKKITYHR